MSLNNTSFSFHLVFQVFRRKKKFENQIKKKERRSFDKVERKISFNEPNVWDRQSKEE